VTDLPTIAPIGVIRTPFREKYAAPRQPGADGEFPVGRVILDRGHNFEQALSDLEGFEKIWLLYLFDRNPNWKPKVLPPRSTVKRGVFSTRSPHRPNPIGLSLVTLLEVRGRTLVVEGVDMLDKTPLLDMKPYLPAIESFPQARTGWVAEAQDSANEPREIVFSPEFIASVSELSEAERSAVVGHIRKMLRFDVRPHPYKRIEHEREGSYTLSYKAWRIGFELLPNGSAVVARLRRA
jgi:tRNA-Thr(GGU) m(6)t(6)A37 methyltransferase TsaA